jgi:hypothetical protein
MAIATRVIADPKMAAAITLINVPAQLSCSAGLDRIHGLVFRLRKAVGLAIFRSILTENLPYFDPGLHLNKVSSEQSIK